MLMQIFLREKSDSINCTRLMSAMNGFRSLVLLTMKSTGLQEAFVCCMWYVVCCMLADIYLWVLTCLFYFWGNETILNLILPCCQFLDKWVSTQYYLYLSHDVRKLRKLLVKIKNFFVFRISKRKRRNYWSFCLINYEWF